MMEKTNPFESEVEQAQKELQGIHRVKVRCRRCHARIFDRVEMTEGWVIHVKRGGFQGFIMGTMVLTCHTCGSNYRISPEKGIEEWIPNTYYDEVTH